MRSSQRCRQSDSFGFPHCVEHASCVIRSHTSELICVLDEHDVITYASPSYERILGYRPDELLGQVGLAYIHPEDRDRMETALHKHWQSRYRNDGHAATGVYEYRMRERQGSYHYLQTTSSLVDDRMVLISRDVTSEKHIQQYREEMIRAEHLASMGTLSAMLAHELNQPLTVIRLAMENIQAQYEDDLSQIKSRSMAKNPLLKIQEQRDVLSDCIRGVEVMTEIISRFRTFARRSGDQPVRSVDLGKVAGDTLMLVQHSAERVGLDISLENMAALLPVASNTRDMNQLFFALIENSIQAAKGKQECRLVIDGKIIDSGIEVCFSDTCGGVTPEHLPHIFQPFFTTKTSGEGTGLGLCTVSRIVEKTGGTLHVENKPGYGITFRICLPSKRP